jgi:hypothetical protein
LSKLFISISIQIEKVFYSKYSIKKQRQRQRQRQRQQTNNARGILLLPFAMF